MKRFIISILVAAALCVSAGAYAAQINLEGVDFGIQGSFNADTFDRLNIPVLFVADIQEEFEAVFGFSSIGLGSNDDAAGTLWLQGTWYPMKTKGFQVGPSVSLVTGSFADPAHDNNQTIFSFGATIKKMVWDNIALKADIPVLVLVSGDTGGSDIEDENMILPDVVLSFSMYFL